MGRTRTDPRRFLIGALIVVAAVLATIVITADDSTGQLTGIVVGMEGDLTNVESFVVLSGGEQRRFVPSDEGDYDFPLGHLRDHLRTGEPIRIEYERVGDVHVAIRISDED